MRSDFSNCIQICFADGASDSCFTIDTFPTRFVLGTRLNVNTVI